MCKKGRKNEAPPYSHIETVPHLTTYFSANNKKRGSRRLGFVVFTVFFLLLWFWDRLIGGVGVNLLLFAIRLYFSLACDQSIFFDLISWADGGSGAASSSSKKFLMILLTSLDTGWKFLLRRSLSSFWLLLWEEGEDELVWKEKFHRFFLIGLDIWNFVITWKKSELRIM